MCLKTNLSCQIGLKNSITKKVDITFKQFKHLLDDIVFKKSEQHISKQKILDFIFQKKQHQQHQQEQ